MKKVSCTDKVAADYVKKFGNHVFWFRKVHHLYKELFENEEAHILMEKTARSFFSDLNTILHNYTLLEFAKITDSSMTMGQENFTIDNLIESIDWPQDTKDELTSLNNKAKIFRNYIIEARNKLLAHMDKEVHLNDKVLGGFPKGEDEAFLQTLEEICDVAHRACFNSIFGQIAVGIEGDVFDLKKTLRRALAFDKLFAESTGTDLAKLVSYLDEVIPNRKL